MNFWKLWGDLVQQDWNCEFLQCLAATLATGFDLVLSLSLWVSSLPGLFHWFPPVRMLTFSQAFITGYLLNPCKTSVSTPPSFRWYNHHFNSSFCIDPRKISPCPQLGQFLWETDSIDQKHPTDLCVALREKQVWSAITDLWSAFECLADWCCDAEVAMEVSISCFQGSAP